MNQASLIGGAVMVAFVAFVAINNRLGVYRNIVVGGAPAGGGQAPAGGGGLFGGLLGGALPFGLGRLLQ